MKVFLDVGAHDGETLMSVLDPKYDFDMIYVFEPVKKLHTKLNIIAARRKNIKLLEYGLWNETITQKIYSPGSIAGSIFSDHKDVDKDDFEECKFVNASEWFAQNIHAGDEVYVKLNCEGAEANILLSLLSSKEIFKIKNVMIDFDVRKIKGLEGMQQDVLTEFKKSNFTSYSLCDDVMTGPSSITRIQNWLDITGAKKEGNKARVNQFFYWIKMVLLKQRPGYWWELKHLIKDHTPLTILKLFGARRS
jgi:FkbM family methyltransferase